MSGRFLDELDFHSEGPTSEIAVLDSVLRYQDFVGRTYSVPPGFRTDLASVPRMLRSLAPPWRQSAWSGVIHDCGYRWFEVWGVSKREMDNLLYEVLRADGTGRIRAWSMWLAVSVGGGGAWYGWRQRDEAEKSVEPDPIQTG